MEGLIASQYPHGKPQQILVAKRGGELQLIDDEPVLGIVHGIQQIHHLVQRQALHLHVQSLQARLDSAGRELQRTLKIGPPITSITVNAALGRVQERLDKLRRDRDAVAYIDRYHYDSLRLFNELSAAVRQQPGVTVDALSFNQERFTMSGTTPSYEESEGLKDRVGELSRFKGRSVKVTHSNVGKVIRYRLSVER